MALLSGRQAPAYAEALQESFALGGPVALSALGPESFLLHAPDHGTLCDLLERTRPVRRAAACHVEVDPARL